MSDLNQLITTLSKQVKNDAGRNLDLTGQEIAEILWLLLRRLERGEPPSALPKTPEEDGQETPSTPEVKVASDDLPNEEATGELYPKTRPIQRQLAAGGQVLTLPVPDAPSLREPLALAQALRPLMRRLPTGSEEILDEIATVNRIAEEGIYFPVMQPNLEPWLDLALVVDESETMVIWRHTIRQLKRFFEHYGAFRDVRTWGLAADETGEVRIQRGIGVIAERQSAASAAELIDPSGRRLVLVVSDCVGSMWRDGKVLPVLETWSNSGPTAILQMLPERMWLGTGLRGGTAVRLQGLTPGVANSNLIVTEQLSSPENDISRGIKLPVLNLEPKLAGIWSQMVAGKGRVTAPGFIFAPAVDEGETESSPQEETGNGRESESKQPESPLISAQEVKKRVHRFRMTASPLARRLAELLAAAPMITLPIVRLIQETLLEKSHQVHVAEVFLGGLLQPRSEIQADTNPDEVQYGFIDDLIEYEPKQPKMRELLLEFASDRETLSVIDSVSKYVASQLRKSLEEFAGLLKAPTENKGGEMQPFARVTATVLKRLGGDYARFAEELEEHWDSGTFPEGETPTPEVTSKLKILVLAVNLSSASQLLLNQALEEVKTALQSSKKPEGFEIESTTVVRVRDIQLTILDHAPQLLYLIVEPAEGLVLEDETGQAKLVDGEALSTLFSLFSQQVECVVLKGAYSRIQAEGIAQQIPYVIGMNQEMGNSMAIEFAVAFFDALGARRSLKSAYQLGCEAIRIAGVAESLMPVLFEPQKKQAVKVFVSYSQEDRDFLKRLEKHLAVLIQQGLITVWHDLKIPPGSKLNEEIQKKLERADIILFLVSADFLASEYINYEELPRAIERHAAGEARVIPIILRPGDWSGTPFSNLQALPRDARPVTAWENQDDAFIDIALGISQVAEEIRLNRETSKIKKKSDLQIFLAHAREDRQKVRELYDRLKNAGYKPWLDVEEDLLPGQNWREEITKAIRSSQIFIACLSPYSLTLSMRGYIVLQFQIALDTYAETDERSPYLIALRLENCEIPNQQFSQVGLSLRDFQLLDYWQEDGFEQLEKAIAYQYGFWTEKTEQIYAPSTEPEEESATTAQASPSLQRGEFETVTVNRKGKIIKRETKTARYYTETLPNNIPLEMVYIPGGKFMMGSPDTEKKANWSKGRESLQREVTVPPFFMGKYPVTQTQWRAIASREDLKVERDLNPNPAYFKDRSDSDRRPVEQVSWYDAVEFCQRLSTETGREYRLPSEAEWEYACRAGTTTPFHFGETITGKLANYDASETYAGEPLGEYRQQTTPVGSFLPNAFGLYDMHGNVWEWCADTWHDNYKGVPTDGSAWIQGGDDNRSPMRGGSWDNTPGYCRSAYRNDHVRGRDYINDNIGFRVVGGVGRTLSP